jgi:putative DNA-invertase from lambdoid prophage Rac
MAVYGYTRVSTFEQASGSSLADQATRIGGGALAAGLSAPEIVEEAGVSGGVPLDERPGGSRLLKKLVRGDTLIVLKLDRAFRDALDALEKFKALEAKGVNLIVADIGLEPVHQNGTGKLLFTVLAGIAEMERNRIAERVMGGKRAKAAKMGYLGGNVPYGYRMEGQGKESRLIPIPEEQKVIELIMEGRKSGMSMRAVADYVGIRTGRKVTWNLVRRVIDRQQRYAA